jgi:uncharacterized membrane protein
MPMSDRSKTPILFLSQQEKRLVEHAIHQAEMKTSGEIRVHLEKKMEEPLLEHAKKIFEEIGMTKTERRNGILILIGIHTHKVVVLGDEGINNHVSPDFWDKIIKAMLPYFENDEFGEGLSQGIALIGEKLTTVFPVEQRNPNELADEISYSK